MPEPERATVIADLLRWATVYYPSRAEPPPDIAAMRLTTDEVIGLFARLPSRQAHLALVDQPAIRHYFADPTVTAAVTAAWDANRYAP